MVEVIRSVQFQPWTWRCSKRKLKQLCSPCLGKNRLHINQKFDEYDLNPWLVCKQIFQLCFSDKEADHYFPIVALAFISRMTVQWCMQCSTISYMLEFVLPCMLHHSSFYWRLTCFLCFPAHSSLFYDACFIVFSVMWDKGCSSMRC